MTAPTLPAPPPPTATHAGEDRGEPAPVSTMLAVLGRIGSHAGDPVSVSVVHRTRTISVYLPGRQSHWRWACETADDGDDAPASPDDLAVHLTVPRMLHGWSLLMHRSAA